MMQNFLPTGRQLVISVVLGVVSGYMLIYLDQFFKRHSWEKLFSFQSAENGVAEVRRVAEPVLLSREQPFCLEACFGYLEQERRVLTPAVPEQKRSMVPQPRRESIPKRILPSAPLPVSALWINGRYVCAKKHDKPGRSKKNKRGHIDLQCCLDPDEVPNPHCDYSYKS